MHAAWDAFERRRILLVGLSVLAGSTLIVVLVVSLLPGQRSPEDTTPSVESEAAASQFINVVIFGVNQLYQQPTELEAVWIGTFDLVNNDGVLLGLPRTFNLNHGLSMAQAFAWSEENQIDQTFLGAVQETLALEVDVVLIMDRVCFQAGIDFIGGLPMEAEQNLSGSAAVALHAMSASDPWLALEVQAQILTRVRQQLEGLGHQPDLAPIFELTPEHCWLNTSDEAASELIMQMFPMTEESIRIDTIADAN